MYRTATLREAVVRCRSTLAAARLPAQATVWESSRAADLALIKGLREKLVIRCVAEITPNDYPALATMLLEGDFDHAILLPCDTKDHPPPPPGVEICSLDELPNVLARLTEKSAAP